MNRAQLQRALRIGALAVWGGALVMGVLLAWRVHRLDATFKRMNVDSAALVKSADDLAESTKRLDEAMQRLQERVKALDAGDAQIVFERVPETR